jgi:hypothetical protein
MLTQSTINDDRLEERTRKLIAAVSGSNAARVLFEYRRRIQGDKECLTTSDDRQQHVPTLPSRHSGLDIQR